MSDNLAEKNLKKAVIPLEGVHCASCVSRIEKGLESVPGLKRVSVNLPSSTAFIIYDPAAVKPGEITARIAELGYKALGILESAAQAENIATAGMEGEKRLLRIKFLAALALTSYTLLELAVNLPPYTVMAAAALAWGWCGAHFHSGLLRALKAGTADMNTLVSLSTSVTFFYGVFITFFPQLTGLHLHAHWHEVAMLITFVNFGRWLEARSKSKAAEAVSGLFKLAPKTARRLKNGVEEVVPAESILPGDAIRLRPGEQVPVDGTVTGGFSSVDEALLTGEPVPQDKAAGAKLYAGTINKTGALEFTATGVGQDMALMKIIKAVEESQAGKNSVQRLVDRISAFFVPAVILTALAAAGVWLYYADAPRAVSVFAAVLAVACPCAMGLAVPMAVSVGFGRAAGLGMLINNAEVLERVPKINVIVFDKTGTLTEGRMKVSLVRPWVISEPQFLALLMSAEESSEHPFAEAVRACARERHIVHQKPDAVEVVPGKGIKVEAGGNRILAGSAKWFAEMKVPVPPIADEEIKASPDSLLLLAENGEYRGYAALSDSVRPEAAGLVAGLSALGISPVIASGDRRGAVAALAASLGIEEFYAEIFPEEKSGIIMRHKAMGKKVAFVGDGFNDAAALSEADLGIALSSGADIAVKASDITLMHGGIAGVAHALKLARVIRRNIIQNLVWAFAYNAALIPLAAGALYPLWGLLIPPYFAGGAMALSSVSVVLNSLRLRRIKL